MSALRISHASRASAHEWQTTWEQCPYATYFQSPYWAQACRDGLGLKPFHAEKLVFSDGASALVPLGLLSELKGLSSRHVMSALGTYGGWISSAPLPEMHAGLLCDWVLAQRNLFWRVSPFLPGVSDAIKRTGTHDLTWVLPLEQGFAAVFGGWSRAHRSSTSKAQRMGVTIRPAASSRDWDAYFQIYQKALRRWGDAVTSNYPRTLFAALSAMPRTQLWLAWVEDTPVAGMICLYSQRHVAYWHGAADEAYFPYRPVLLMVKEALHHACEGGYAWFDFNPSGGHEGVARFKRGFGALELSAPVITRDTPFRQLVTAARRKIHAPAAAPAAQ